MRRILTAAALALLLPLAAQAQIVAQMKQVAVTCNSTSTPILAARQATQYIEIHQPVDGCASPIWVNYAGADAVTAPPSEEIACGQTKIMTLNLPSDAVACIVASGSQTFTLIYR